MLLLTFAWLLASLGLGYAYGDRLRARGLTVDTAFRTGPRAWVFLASLLVVAGSLYMLFKHTGWLSPELSGFLQAFVWAFLKGNLAFLGGMAMPLSLERSRLERVLTLALVLLAIGIVQHIEGWVFAPVYGRMSEVRRAADGSILQTQGASCTAAALANLLPLFGRRASEADCARALGTTRFGTTISQVMAGIRTFGLYGYYVSAEPEALRLMGRPALLTVWSSGGARHSLALVGARGTDFEIIDPLSGRGTIAASTLKALLADSRAVVLVADPVPSDDAEAWLLKARGRTIPDQGPTR